MTKKTDDVDVPFLKNDMNDPAATMDKPLDPADGPGKADAEMADFEDPDQPGESEPAPHRYIPVRPNR